MFTAIFLFVFYCSIFLGLLYYLQKKKLLQVGFAHAALFFLLKAGMGCLYGYLFLTLYNGDDTWVYHEQGIRMKQQLINDPWGFFTDIFQNGYPGSLMNSLFETNNSYWKSLEYVVLIKMLAIFNVFSGGHYYVNVVLFSMLTFWGNYLLYKIFIKYFPDRRNIILLLVFYFLPMVFWTSGIRKDGLIILLIGIFFYYFSNIVDGKNRLRYWIIVLLSLLMSYIIRNYVALSLMPAAVAWHLASGSKIPSVRIFAAVYVTGIILFFASHYFHPSLDLPQKVAKRQSEFMALEGGSYISVEPLQPDFVSYLNMLPQGLLNTFLRPYIGERNSYLYQGSALETLFCLLFFITAIILKRKDYKHWVTHPFMLAIFFFALTNYLLIGFTVPFVGAIVRYKSVYELMFLVFFCVLLDTGRLIKRAGIK
ncbi:MAG: hypothetical protein SFU87_08505 [Chitinophagaceae bacterium]|nr:hypothetical protein [Chitinophagaceae bacterium]